MYVTFGPPERTLPSVIVPPLVTSATRKNGFTGRQAPPIPQELGAAMKETTNDDPLDAIPAGLSCDASQDVLELWTNSTSPTVPFASTEATKTVVGATVP